ncbi:conserved hypothetical protein [Neospora caninum Liverpool]|uniref:Transmembrane protein n=1 Tax=Neospora caninum (strain Liverpool) TaxID=572307 RepID=F0VIH5_NEOCL|nr:conserved hypothetical protein [Neospora caninum Liverpool]CBZ53536.1 conserved hypothetical protein [Neospora caninum Liverpool]CEL67524.1 TPA: hypothetical protein BN1204_033240 [Neospora caninum Liverpool]|eukprot:XP_003883568.1 conserved hypothetical protein [Neospora caninum Liverpool]
MNISSCTSSTEAISSRAASVIEPKFLALYALESVFGSARCPRFSGVCGGSRQQGETAGDEVRPGNGEQCDEHGRNVADRSKRTRSGDGGHQGEKTQQIQNRGGFTASGFFSSEGTRRSGSSLFSFLKPRMALSGPPVVTHSREGMSASCQSNSHSRLSVIPRDYAIINIPVEVALHPVVFQTLCSLAETLRRFERTLMLTATTAATALALGIALPRLLQIREGGWNVQAATAVAVLLVPMFVAMRCTYAAVQ